MDQLKLFKGKGGISKPKTSFQLQKHSLSSCEGEHNKRKNMKKEGNLI